MRLAFSISLYTFCIQAEFEFVGLTVDNQGVTQRGVWPTDKVHYLPAHPLGHALECVRSQQTWDSAELLLPRAAKLSVSRRF